MNDYDCNCKMKRDVKVMDYDNTTGTCTVCYGKVDLTPPEPLKFFKPTDGNEATIHFLDEAPELPVHWNNKVCTGCRKTYQPIMADDGDCCPICAQY